MIDTNQNQPTPLELTPAEQEMIRLKREKEAIATKEAEIKKQIQMEKDIADKRIYISKTQSVDQNRIVAAKAFLTKFPQCYELKITTGKEQVKILDYKNTDANGNYVVLWAESFERKTPIIVYKGWTINVHYKNGKYQMFASGPKFTWSDERRSYTRPSTLIAKISLANTQIVNEETAKNDIKNSVQQTVKKLREMYPGATVVHQIAGRYTGDPYSRHRNWINYDEISIKFINGVEVAYQIFPNGTMSRTKLSLNIKDEWAQIDAMSKIVA